MLKALGYAALWSLGILLLGVSLGRAFRGASLPPHLLGHPVVVLPDLLDATQQAELLSLAHEIGSFGSVTGAENSYNMTHEDIGEGLAHPARVDGGCSHAFLVPSKNTKRCILPGRVDVGRHYVLTGGVEGLKEQHADLASRAQSFIAYIFDPSRHASTAKLLNSTAFLAAARAVCPQRDAAVLDPFQTSIIVQVPGQTVPAHLDGVWLWGADRFHVPQWLLAVMAFSGLFSERFVHQVQIVGYFGPPGVNGRSGGAFTHWANGRAEAVPCTPGSGSSMDGSKTVHAAAVFEPAAAPPALSKDAVNALVHVPGAGAGGGGEWELRTNGAPRGRWAAGRLRFSVVYRARCFSSEAERAAFAAAQRTGEGRLDLEVGILAPLKDEAVRRGAAASREQLDALPRLDLALKLLDTFIAYPRPDVPLPLNYCALPLAFPGAQWLARVVGAVCPRRAAPGM
jgi:hypothetical protein